MHSRKSYISDCITKVAGAKQQHRIWVQFVRDPDSRCAVNREERDLELSGDAFSAGKGKPIGVVICYWFNDGLMLGASACNPRDTFDRHIGTRKAIEHAKVILYPTVEEWLQNPRALDHIPRTCQSLAVRMAETCFKQRSQSQASAVAPAESQ